MVSSYILVCGRLERIKVEISSFAVQDFCIKEATHFSHPFRRYNSVNYRPCQCGQSSKKTSDSFLNFDTYTNKGTCFVVCVPDAHPDLATCRLHCVAPDPAPLPGYKRGKRKAVDTGIRPGKCTKCYSGEIRGFFLFLSFLSFYAKGTFRAKGWQLSWTSWSECHQQCARVRCRDDCREPEGIQFSTLEECKPEECQGRRRTWYTKCSTPYRMENICHICDTTEL